MDKRKPLQRSFINRYQGSSLFERIGKDLRFIFQWLILWFRYGFKSRTLLAWPELPSRRTTLYKIARRSGYTITNNLRCHSKIAIFWEDATIRGRYEELEAISERMPLINHYSDNILKTWVDDFFNEVFGYRSRVNPLTHNGPAVLKSEYNAQHDGHIIECPIEKAEADAIYQIVINNRCDEGYYEDLRIPVIDGKIPFVYRKLKTDDKRFETAPVKALLLNPNDCLSHEEQILIVKFAKAIQLDFGEIDGLRNRDDGKLYLIDVNNTPYGPPANLSLEDAEMALSLLGKLFWELSIRP